MCNTSVSIEGAIHIVYGNTNSPILFSISESYQFSTTLDKIIINFIDINFFTRTISGFLTLFFKTNFTSTLAIMWTMLFFIEI